jgi:hypothetical protein
VPGFFFFVVFLLGRLRPAKSLHARIFTGRNSVACNKAGLRKPMFAKTILTQVMIAQILEIAIATARQRSAVLRGYPLAMIKKKRVCGATYQHSGDQLFEN